MVKNLGNLSGPLLIFGGPYSNFQALEALKTIATELNIPPNQCICTGDIVAYCAQPKETVKLIREWGIHCIMGNCEESFALNADDCGCGFGEGSQCDLLSTQWFNYANEQLKHEERLWFSQLPQHIRFNYYGKNCLVVHGSVSSINQFIFESTDIEKFINEFLLAEKLEKTDIIFGGHCGIPFTKKINRRIWHNAGAIGMPANDGTPRTWYSIIDNKDTELIFDIQALNYDYKITQKTMQQASLNNGYTEALASGLWPSIDVLPKTEKQQQGKPLTF